MGSSSNKSFDFCRSGTIYLLGKQRNESLDKTLSGQQNCSSASDLSPKKGSDKLNVARSQNPNRILITHLNINSLRNKFEILKETITNKVNILLMVLQLHIGLQRSIRWRYYALYERRHTFEVFNRNKIVNIENIEIGNNFIKINL